MTEKLIIFVSPHMRQSGSSEDFGEPIGDVLWMKGSFGTKVLYLGEGKPSRYRRFRRTYRRTGSSGSPEERPR